MKRTPKQISDREDILLAVFVLALMLAPAITAMLKVQS